MDHAQYWALLNNIINAIDEMPVRWEIIGYWFYQSAITTEEYRQLMADHVW